ncbi:MAG: formate dehydrogenase iron-sulfur subunit [Desulfobacteraceae bacterium Eth-SRB1]|nr:MAG: formate dehydrogenase iron-sulfur subunit [Desulfobacteraceae bacterium Eth-SRB1]
MSKAFFIDTSRCTACRGCQVACKEWHELPATKTRQRGTHQNPVDLNPYTYKLVRFREHKVNDTVKWNFFPDQCRHCLEAPCKDVADNYVKGAVVRDEETGAIIYTELTKQLPNKAFEEMRSDCPYDIPRRHDGTGLIVKCDMCIDRVSNGLLPMCVKTCPSGAMNFGARKEMLNMANKRLAVLKREYPKAQLVDEDDVNVIYLITEKPEFYHDFVLAQGFGAITRKAALAKLVSPVKAQLRPLQNLFA